MSDSPAEPCDTMLVVMRRFLEPIREGLMRTFCTVGVDGVAGGGGGEIRKWWMRCWHTSVCLE